jgi:hypothetical protein
MATFYEQATRGIDVEHEVSEPDDAPTVRYARPTTRKHAHVLGPFRSRIIRVPHPALAARRDEQA